MASAGFFADAEDWRVERDPVLGRARALDLFAVAAVFAEDVFFAVVAMIVSYQTARGGAMRSAKKREMAC